jgi:2,4-dienoyl-CoA reductase-like NADH-dependent reductase (Old Yellow Enzyme family)
MMMMEACAVSPEGRISPQDLGIYKDQHIPMLKRITEFVHAMNGRIGIQLAHAGRKASTWPLFFKDGRSLVTQEHGGWPDQVVAPSPITFAEYTANPKELTKSEIRQLIQSFGEAARRANEAGFDVIEIHGAHGYLIHEFLSPVSNARTDEFGGTLENRSRFLVDIVKVARSQWPSHKPLFLRLSCTDWLDSSSWDLEEVTQVVKMVSALGVDVIDCSTGGAHPDQKIKYGPLFQVPYAEHLKRNVPNVHIIAVGNVKTPEEANGILAKEQADFVILGREYLRDSWIQRAAHTMGVDIGYINQYERGKL